MDELHGKVQYQINDTIFKFCKVLAEKYGSNCNNLYAIHILGSFKDEIIEENGELIIIDKITKIRYAKLVNWIPEPL